MEDEFEAIRRELARAITSNLRLADLFSSYTKAKVLGAAVRSGQTQDANSLLKLSGAIGAFVEITEELINQELTGVNDGNAT